MILSLYILLGLIAIIPSYGIGYLINALSHRWWLAIPIYIVLFIAAVWAGHFSLTAMEWFALAAVGLGVTLSSWTVWRFKKGNYRRFIS